MEYSRRYLCFRGKHTFLFVLIYRGRDITFTGVTNFFPQHGYSNDPDIARADISLS